MIALILKILSFILAHKLTVQAVLAMLGKAFPSLAAKVTHGVHAHGVKTIVSKICK